MSDIELVALVSEAGRQLLAVFPDMDLARASLGRMTWSDAIDSYAEQAALHDYWWPLVRGAGTREDFIVMEDTRGITAARLSLTARSVTAVFDSAEDGRWLQKAGCSNVQIVVHPKPCEWLAGRKAAADVAVWQRPSRHLQGLSPQQRRAAFASFNATIRPGGTLIVDDNLCEPWWARLLSRKDEDARNYGLVELRTLKTMVPGGDAFVGIRPLRRWNWPAAELKHRDSRRSITALIEGRFRHSLGLRELRRYVVPRKALVLNRRRHALLDHVLTQEPVRGVLGGAEPEVRKLFAGTGDVTIALVGVHGKNTSRVALRFGYQREAVARLARGKAALEHFADGPLSALVPRLLCADLSSTDGAFTAETFLTGRAISELPWGARRDSAFEQAAKTLDSMVGEKVDRAVIDGATYQRLVGDAIDLIGSSLPAGQCPALDRVSARLRSAFIGKTWPLHLVHGDFKAGNILVGRDGNISGFIDWDMWEEKGLPLQDLLVLFAYDWSKVSGLGFGPRVLPDLLAGSWRPIYEHILGERARVLCLSGAQVRVLRAVFWLRNIQDRTPRLVFVNRDAIKDWIDEPLRQIEAVLAE